ncbi:MAG: hypothetical protein AAB769_00685 [Patescibacteria group bacterium]
MKIISGHPTHLFHRLVAEGEFRRGVTLGQEMESYLVFLLARYVTKAEIAVWDAATAYLDGVLHQRVFRYEKMKETGDACLLLSGLFPERAKKRVSLWYYREVGQGAYGQLGADPSCMGAETFRALAAHFSLLTEVLQSVRHTEGQYILPYAHTLRHLAS